MPITMEKRALGGSTVTRAMLKAVGPEALAQQPKLRGEIRSLAGTYIRTRGKKRHSEVAGAIRRVIAQGRAKAKTAENESSTPEQIGEGDGKTTASATPDARNSGTHGVSSQPGRGTVPQPGQSGETFGPSFEGLDKRSPFVEMLTSRIKMKQQSQQEKQSMDISPHMMRAFQDELVHLRREKQASILTAVGKGVMGLARGGAKGGMRRGLGAGALNMARKAGFRGANATKAVGGAAIGAGALGAAGLGAAAS